MCGGEGGREGGEIEEGMGGRKEVMKGGERAKETLYQCHGNAISRFFEILKIAADYLKRQSGKSVMTSVSQFCMKQFNIVHCMQQCAVHCVSIKLPSVVPFSPQTKGFASCTGVVPFPQ